MHRGVNRIAVAPAEIFDCPGSTQQTCDFYTVVTTSTRIDAVAEAPPDFMEPGRCDRHEVGTGIDERVDEKVGAGGNLDNRCA